MTVDVGCPSCVRVPHVLGSSAWWEALVTATVPTYLMSNEPLPSQSEYVAACDERRAFVSGFTGSAGTAVITPTEAALWTDGRCVGPP